MRWVANDMSTVLGRAWLRRTCGWAGRQRWLMAAGVLLLTAAVAKCVGAMMLPLSAYRFPLPWPGYLVVVAFESALGIAAMLVPGSVWVGGLCAATFLAFLVYHGVGWLTGFGASCDCFGAAAEIPPWLSAVFAGAGAACSVVAIWGRGKDFRRVRPSAISPRARRLCFALALGVSVCLTSLTAHAVSRSKLAHGGMYVSGRRVWLEPTLWLGKPLLLRPFLPSSIRPDVEIVLLRSSCGHCTALYRTALSDEHHCRGRLFVFIDRVPSDAPRRCSVALDRRYEWIAPTPVRVRVRDWLVVGVAPVAGTKL